MIKYDNPIGLDDFIRESGKYENSDVFTGEYFKNVLNNSDVSLSGKGVSAEELTRKQKGYQIMAEDIKNNNLGTQLNILSANLHQKGLDALVFPKTNKGANGQETVIGYTLLVYDPKYKDSVIKSGENGSKQIIDTAGEHSFAHNFDVAYSDTVKYGHSRINTPVDLLNADKNIVTRVKANEAQMMILNEKLQTTGSSSKFADKSNLDAARAAFTFADKEIRSLESKVNTNLQDKDDLSYATGSQEFDSMLANRINVAPFLEQMKWAYGMFDDYRGKVMEIMALVSQAKSRERALKIIEAREHELKQGFGDYNKADGYDNFKKMLLNSYDRGVIWDFAGVGENAIRSMKMSTMDRNDIAGDIFMSSSLREQGRKNTQNIIGHGKTDKERKADAEKKAKMFTRGILASKTGEAKGIKYASGVMDENNDNQIAYDASVLAVEMDDTDLANQGFQNLSVKEGQSVVSKPLSYVLDTSHHTMNYSYTNEDMEKAKEGMLKRMGKLKDKKRRSAYENEDLANLQSIFDENGNVIDALAFAARMFKHSLKDNGMNLFKTDEQKPDSSFVNVYRDDYGGITVSGEGVTPMKSGRKIVDTFNNIRSAATVAENGEFGRIKTSSGKFLSDYNIQAIFGRDALDARKYGTRLKSDINTTLIDLREVGQLDKFFDEIKADSKKEVAEGDIPGELLKRAAKFFGDVLEYDKKSGKVYVTDDQEKVDKYIENASKEQLSVFLNYLDTLRDKFGGNQGFGKVYGIDENGNLFRTKNTRTFRANIGGDNNYTYGDYSDEGAVDFRTGHDSLVRALNMAASKMTPEEKEKFKKKRSEKTVFDVAEDLASQFDAGEWEQQEWEELKDSNKEAAENMKNTLGKNKHFDVKNLDKNKYITVGVGEGFDVDAKQAEVENWNPERTKVTNEEKTLTHLIDKAREDRAKEVNEARAAEIANTEKEIAGEEKELAALKKENEKKETDGKKAKERQKKIEEKQKEIDDKKKKIDELKAKEEAKAEDFQVVVDLQGNKFGETTIFDNSPKTYGVGGRALFLDKKNGHFKGYSGRAYRTDINDNLVRALQSGDGEKIANTATELVKTMANSIRNKEGGDYKKLLKNKMAHSAMGSTLGFNVRQIMSQDDYESEMAKDVGQRDNLKILKSEIASYGAEISRETAREFLDGKSADGNGDDLFTLDNLREMLKKFGLSYKTKEGKNRDIGSMKREEIINHILDAITVDSEDWKKAYKSGTLTEGLKGVLGRFPFMNGLDLDTVSKIFIGDDLKGNAIRLGAGIAMKQNADFDGDHEAMKLLKLSPEERLLFDKSEEIKKAVMQRLAWIAKDKYEEADKNRQVFNDDFYLGVSKKMMAQSAEIAGRRNKGAVGVFSNYASQLRNMMRDIRFDETGVLSTEGGKENGIAAILIRSYFEALEQDAISAKKIINRLTKQYKEQGITKTKKQIESDALAYQKKILEETDDLMQQFREKKITFETLNEKLKDMMILGSNGELNNRVTEAALLTVENGIDGGKDLLRKLYRENGSKYYEYGMYGRATEKDVDFAKQFAEEGKGGFEEWVKTKEAQALLKKLDRAGVKYEGRDQDFYELLLSGKVKRSDYGTVTNGVYLASLNRGAQYAKSAGEAGQDGTVDSFIRAASNKTHTPEKRDYSRVYNFGELTEEQKADLEGGAEGIDEANEAFSNAIAKLKENGGEIGNALALILEAISGFAKGTGALAKNTPMTAKEGAEILANAEHLAPYSTSTLTNLVFPEQQPNQDPQLVDNILKNKDKKYFGYSSESQLRSIVGDGIYSSLGLRGNVYGSKTEYIAKLRELATRKGWKWDTSEDLERLFNENKESLQQENDPNIGVILNAQQKYESDKEKYFEFLKTLHGENGLNDMAFFLGKNGVKSVEELLPGWEKQIDALSNYFSPENMADVYDRTENGKEITHKAQLLPEAGFIGVTGRDGKYSYVGRTDMAGLRKEKIVYPNGDEKEVNAFRSVDLKTKMGETLSIKDVLQGLLNDAAMQQNLHLIKDKYAKKGGSGYQGWLQSNAYKALANSMKNAGIEFDSEELYKQLSQADVAGQMILRTNPTTGKTDLYQIGSLRDDIKDRTVLDLVDKYLHGQTTKEELAELLKSLPTALAQAGVVTEEAEKDPKLKYKDASEKEVAADYLSLEKKKNAAVERKKVVDYLLKDTSIKKSDAEIEKLKKEAADLDEEIKETDKNIEIAKGTNANLKTAIDKDGKEVDVGKEIRADKRLQKAKRDEAIQEEQQKAQTKLETTLSQIIQIQERMRERTVRSNAAGLNGLSEEQKLAFALENKKDQSELDALERSLQGVNWEKAVGGAGKMAEITKKVGEETAVANQKIVALNSDLNPSIWKQITMSVKGYFNQMVRGQLVWKIMGQVQRAIKTVIEDAKKLDSVLVNLQIVTGDTRDGARSLITTYASLAKQMSATTSEVASAANDWLRQGYSVAESIDLITASLQLSKLGMIDSGKATSYLTSMLKGFKLEASDATTIVDKLTKVDMSAATSAGDIAEALRQFATTAQLSGMDLNESIAMATTIMDVSQKDAASTGNAIKTILSRFGNVKAGTYSGMNITGDQNETTESLNDIDKVLSKLGISLRTSNLEFRDFDDVLDDIAAKWETLDSVSKNAIATAMAGTRQRESFLVLMENYDKYKDFIEEAADAEGTAAEKYKAYEDSLEASQKKLSAAWEELASKTEVVDFLKRVNGVMATMVKWLPEIARVFVRMFSGKAAANALNILQRSGSLNVFSKEGLKKGVKSLFDPTYGIGPDGKARNGLIDSQIRKGTGPILAELKKLVQITSKNKKEIKKLKSNPIKDKKKIKEYKEENGSLRKQRNHYANSSDGFEEDEFIATHAEDATLSDGTKFSDITKDSKGNYHAKGHKGAISKEEYKKLAQQQEKNNKAAEEEYKNYKKKQQSQKAVAAAAAGIAGFMSADTRNGHVNKFTGEYELNETTDENAKGLMKANTGIATALGTYFMGEAGGALMGAIADELNRDVIGRIFSTVRNENLKNDRFAQADKKKKQAKEASSSITNVVDLASKETLTADDYSSLVKAQDELKDFMTKPENTGFKDEFVAYANKFLAGQSEGNEYAAKSFDELTNLADMTDAQRKKTAYALKVAQTKQNNLAENAEYEKELDGLNTDLDKDYLDVSGYNKRAKANTLALMGSGAAVGGIIGASSGGAFAWATALFGAVVGGLAGYGTAKAANAIDKKMTLDSWNDKSRDEQIAALKEMKAQGQGNSAKLDAMISKLQNINDTIKKIRDKMDQQRVEEGILEMSIGKNADGTDKTLLDLSPNALKDMGTDEIVERMATYLQDRFGGMADGSSYFYTDENGNKQVTAAARKSILRGLKANTDIYNAISGQNSRLSDVLGMKDGQTKTEMLNSFANALHVSVEELQGLGTAFGNFTLGDLTASAEDLSNKFSNMQTAIMNIASGTQSWATTLQSVAKTYPELLGYASDEYTLASAMFQKMSDYQKLQTDAQMSDIMANETYFDTFSDKLKESLSGDEWEEFRNAQINSFNDLQQYVANHDTDLSKKLNEAAQAELKNITLMSDKERQVLEKVVSIKNAQIDKEINNLNSQKEAMQNINSQREYENKLIEAKLRLENASKEKKRVWREGVGWVYEEDQSAIAEAKDNLDSVTNEKGISAITKQINQLNADKDYLSSILSDQEEAMQEAFLKAYSDVNGVTGENIESLGSSIQKTLEGNSQKASDKWDAWMKEYRKKEDTSKNLLKKQYDDLQKAKAAMEDPNLSDEQRAKAKEAYNTALSNYQKTYNEGLSNGYWQESDFGEGGSMYEKFGGPNDAAAAGNGGAGYTKAEPDQFIYQKDDSGGWHRFVYNPGKNGVLSSNDWNKFYDKHGKAKATLYNASFGDEGGNHKLKVNADEHDRTAKAIYDAAKSNATSTGFAKWLEDNINGPVLARIWNSRQWVRFLGGVPYKLDAPESISEDEVPDDIRKAGGSFKEGSTDISKGNRIPLLMNEEGSEAIVTPSGTITALPAHSGIVPADITSNLWNLGNYAPDLLSALQRQALLGMSVSGTAADNSVDNSVSINTVQMTVDADGGFNVDSFVQQLRQVAALTRNNKH